MPIQNHGVTEISATDIQDWILAYLGDLLEIDPEDIDVTVTFDRYGLDSSAAVVLTGDLENWLKRDINPTLLYDYPTIQTLVTHLAEELEL